MRSSERNAFLINFQASVLLHFQEGHRELKEEHTEKDESMIQNAPNVDYGLQKGSALKHTKSIMLKMSCVYKYN